MTASVRPGQVWQWSEPTGKTRTMLVQYVKATNGTIRAFGMHPKSRRRLQRAVRHLVSGAANAKLLSEDASYVYEPTKPRNQATRWAS